MLIAPYVPGGLKLWLSSGLVARGPISRSTRSVMAALASPTSSSRIVTSPSDLARARRPSYRRRARREFGQLSAGRSSDGRRSAVSVPGLGTTSVQGDARFVDILASMGWHRVGSRPSKHGGDAATRHTAARGLCSRHVGHLRSGADAGRWSPPRRSRGSAVSGSSAPRRATAWAISPTNSPRSGARVLSVEPDGLLIEADRPAARRRDAPRPPGGDGVRPPGSGGGRNRDRGSGGGVEELAELLGALVERPGTQSVAGPR